MSSENLLTWQNSRPPNAGQTGWPKQAAEDVHFIFLIGAFIDFMADATITVVLAAGIFESALADDTSSELTLPS